MRIIPFPGRGEASPDESWHTELDAALTGEADGSAADSWRELRKDVRALAPPMAPGFERQLRERIAERRATRRPRKVPPADLPGASTVAPPAALQDPARSGPGRLDRWLDWLRRPRHLGTAAMIVIGAVVAAAVISGPRQASTSTKAAPDAGRSAAAQTRAGASAPAGANRATESTSAPATSGPAEPAPSGAASTTTRLQQLGASMTLAATPNDVQDIADRVARVTVSDGGFVQNSHVQVQQTGTSEANLVLRLPSAKLSAALAALGQLAPVRAESQSLQDITDTYDAAHRRLADATAERQALLRALSAATTQGQIDSLRERLSQARDAVTQARSALQAVSQRASTAEVEVTVVGDARAGSEGLTLHRGLHDAARVLVVALIVLLVASAVIVPLALLLAVLVTGRRAWYRYQRERALDAH
jgi:Domain of unknown function (DUF4349)